MNKDAHSSMKTSGQPHLCSDDHGEHITPCDLPVAQAVKDEWNRLETRRHFLGRSGKVLAWAGLASIMGNVFSPD